MKRLLILGCVLAVLAGCASSPTKDDRARSYDSLLQSRFTNSEQVLKAVASRQGMAAGVSDVRVLRGIVGNSLSANERAQLSRGYELDMAQMLARCDETFQTYEGRAERGRQASFWTAMVGTIAGAVIVPGLAAKQNASKSAIAAWGGLSGAANTAQSVMKDVGIDAMSQIATREAIIKKFHDAIQKFVAATTEDQKELAIVEGYSACIAYAVAGAKLPSSGGK